jgi:hypothetical protein
MSALILFLMIASAVVLTSVPDEVQARPPLARGTDGWALEIIDTEGAVGISNSIAIDQLGVIHVVYSDSTNYHLKYATNAGGRWNVSVIDDDG